MGPGMAAGQEICFFASRRVAQVRIYINRFRILPASLGLCFGLSPLRLGGRDSPGLTGMIVRRVAISCKQFQPAQAAVSVTYGNIGSRRQTEKMGHGWLLSGRK
jgi:hypothetical protein